MDSQPDWERIHAMQDKDIDLSDIPEVHENQMARATLRIGGKPVPKDKPPEWPDIPENAPSTVEQSYEPP